MTSRFRTEDGVELRFGAGRHTRASPDQIDPRECTEGENFLLDPGNDEFRRREPIERIGVLPGGESVSGFVTLKKTDGTVSMLVQGEDKVYEWDGSDFTQVGTCNSSAKLRGRIEHFWALGDKVIITDLSLNENIAEWDGTTYSSSSFFQKDGSTVFSNFKAKYCIVDNERVIFANLDDNGTALPHVITGTTRGAYTNLIDTGFADADRPGTSLSEEDPWFIPAPQLKPINGLAFAYGVLAISQEGGAFETLTGSTAKDFALVQLHDGSGAIGDEAVVSTFNDVIYGAPGHIESLMSTDKFGDVELDDPSFWIRPDIEAFDDWTLVRNRRLRRIYCFPTGGSEVHVLFTDFLNADVSPWSKYTTKASFAFQVTAAMNCFDPVDGLEYVFMGDANGNVYRMEGSGTAGDMESTAIKAFRRSMLYSAPADAKGFNFSGWLRHRRLNANTAEVKMRYAGEHANDHTRDIVFSAVDYEPVYGGSAYYGGEFYYGIVQLNRLVRRTFEIAGFSNDFEIEVTVDGTEDFAINQVGIRYDAAS